MADDKGKPTDARLRLIGTGFSSDQSDADLRAIWLKAFLFAKRSALDVQQAKDVASFARDEIGRAHV